MLMRRSSGLPSGAPSRRGTGLTGPLTRLRDGWASLRWYVDGIVGANAYSRYVAHLGRNHPGAPVPTERDFWRQHYADQEANPTTRCC